ncbi:GHMP family kinase ATP-binding protein [Streptomyces sp. NPDC003483]
MLISQAPLRISLAGGGTDLPSYANRFGGKVLGTVMDKYVTVLSRPRLLDHHVRACLDTCHVVPTADLVHNPFAREALSRHWDDSPLDLVSLGDVPGGSGLGSSAAFCVALVAALEGAMPDTARLAEQASAIEMDGLARSVGKQDHYLSALGGFQLLTFDQDGSVRCEEVSVDPAAMDRLDQELLLFFTGTTRNASNVLSAQDGSARGGPSHVDDALHGIKELVDEAVQALQAGDTRAMGDVLDRHWQLKRGLGTGITCAVTDERYAAARAAGATGGKLLGAGGGGYLLLVCPPEAQPAVRRELSGRGMTELKFQIGGPGARLVDFAELE